jgi:hypothetical protein
MGREQEGLLQVVIAEEASNNLATAKFTLLYPRRYQQNLAL